MFEILEDTFINKQHKYAVKNIYYKQMNKVGNKLFHPCTTNKGFQQVTHSISKIYSENKTKHFLLFVVFTTFSQVFAALGVTKV